MSTRRRVAVTGVGVVSPLGSTVGTFWDGLVAGTSGVTDDLRFDAGGLACTVAAHVRGFDPLDHADARVVRTADPAAVMLLAAAREALAMAGPGLPAPAAETGVVAGVDVAAGSLMRTAVALDRRGPIGVDAFAITQGLPNNASSLVVAQLGPRGAHMAVSAACASGAVATHLAADMIRAGRLSAAIACCASAVDRLVAAACSAARVLTRRSDPASASRPFDADRDGFVLGEGAAALVLEDLDGARRRGAPILAELLGGHQTASSAGATLNPADDCADCMRGALRDAGVAPGIVDLVGAHATGTRVGDVQEARAIGEVFGGRRVPAVAAKSVLGHCMSAGAGLELVAAVLALRDGIAPPTMNRDTPDPDCDVDPVPGTARAMDIGVVLKDAFGFGGVNCCLVLARPEHAG